FTTNYSEHTGVTVPLHQIDLATDTVSTRMNILPSAPLTRGADASLLFGVEPTGSTGPVFTYDAATDSFQQASFGGFNNSLSAVSRDGSLIAMDYQGSLSVMDRNFHVVQILSGSLTGGGVAFDPNRDVLYAASTATSQVIAYDTHTWKELYRIAVGETVGAGTPFGSGEMTVSNDSSELFLSTASGARALAPPLARGQPARLDVSGFPSFIRAGGLGTFTVTAKDPAGYVVPEFTGTVHFASTDPNSLLPQDYSF